MRWTVRPFDSAVVSRLASANVRPVVARLLAQRGVETPEAAAAFLHPKLEDLHSPYLMAGMTRAVERLLAAIERKEKILIYGDYDVDGTTAVVILKTGIELCGGAAEYHVPHRIREGYGMKDDVIERAGAEGVRLIISVDTGIRAFDAAETAARLGIDLIVTDHHLPESAQGLVPKAHAVLNPNQPGCEYPCKSLCGAGVAFKLVQALLEKRKDAAERRKLELSFLKMVAIATVADAVPLQGENRVFAKLGLEGLRTQANPGLRALIACAQLDPRKKPLTAADIAFRIAPRLNAAGRMDVARDVIELFSVRDEARAKELAEKLNKLNSDRQQEEARIIAAIHERIEGDAMLRESFCIVVDGDDWHRGVIGIAATRVVERFNRPALVVAKIAGEAHGSGRSIPAFHLLDALEASPELFDRFGGHAHAVGFALPSERVPELRARLDAYARTKLTLADFEPALLVDSELEFKDITPALLEAVQQLEPFGMGNREPVFAVRDARIAVPPKILKEKHLKLRVVADGGSRALDLLGWRMAELMASHELKAGDAVEFACKLDENAHPDFGGLQLTLCDLRKHSAVAE
ncbi:MAG: single-stranded-DNA-specific exonuclease RecJ [Candidatus Koribacter versatilis]|uniref:Single-stranded-DNA-specific exonuclease RecJ n=1 Tax=Candidatus Korobacter versatilis TaxID=658062 RepID=A0A932EQF6_9BACT|nr:single-stranded-DNA-specific exonuclease RecJ [Candidatus Koribacter versatilis]